MLLIEADGKALFASAGIPVPPGVMMIAPDPQAALPGAGPWMVKAQVPVGGRGKEGGIARCATIAAVAAATAEMLGSRLKGHRIDACLVEQAIAGQERYLAIMIDAASYGLRVIYAAQGGIDIEQQPSAVHELLCLPHADAVAESLADLLADEPDDRRKRIVGIAHALAAMVIERELALAEINPLFVTETGCLAGDAKIVVDISAVDRQPMIAELIAARPTIYLDACRKLTEGFDYVELDPQGTIGLVTTGAGLSMMLIDEMTDRGLKPLNFCDIRTGQMRGSPARLMRVLQWITAGACLRAVLVNIFAGITDLAEFADLLASALDQSPSVTVPVVARLVGRGAAEAARVLAGRRPDVLVTGDLEEALNRIASIVRAGA